MEPPTIRQVCSDSMQEMVNFACETRGSEVLVWESIHFIGNGRIQFASYEDIGTIKSSEINSDVRAILTGNEMRNGVRVLLCNLTVPISSASLTRPHLIVCLNTGLNTQASSLVEVIG